MGPIPIWLRRREVRTPEGSLCVDKGKSGDPQAKESCKKKPTIVSRTVRKQISVI